MSIETMSADAIADRLVALDGWTYDGSSIQKRFEFRDFPEALAFVVRVGVLAEKQWHHPEIRNVYNRVEIRLSTHEAGGVTTRDFELASAIAAFG